MRGGEAGPQGGESGERVHLLFPPGARPRARALAVKLAPILGGTILDLSQKLRYSGGWLARSAPPEEAWRIRGIVEEMGFSCLVAADDGPITPPKVIRVRVARFDGRTLLLEGLPGAVELPLDGVACFDFVVVGDPEFREGKFRDSLRRLGEMMLSDLPFARQREAIATCYLRQPMPTLFLVPREPEELYKIERGTRFPDLTARLGGGALDNLLLFLDELMTALPSGRILPETVTFWESGKIESILIHRREELQRRLEWLRELVARDLWHRFL
ncbi:MAG: hypothetical protein ACE5GW_11445 [Planctomycetota bacterium]